MSADGAAPPTVVAYAPRDRSRAWAKRLAGKRSGKITITRTLDEFRAVFHHELIDVALVDLGAGNGADGAVVLAREYPTVAFLALATLRAAEGPMVARCAELEFADLLVEGVDDDVARELITRYAYSTRFGNALSPAPPELGLESSLHRATWSYLITHGGRPALTSAIAGSLGVTREHLSRSFGTGRAPSLKRVIDLVRLLSAAELAKNPGYDVKDVARVLRYSSSTHLSSTATRLIGRRASSLSALRGVDVVERFAREHVANGRFSMRPELALSARLRRGDS